MAATVCDKQKKFGAKCAVIKAAFQGDGQEEDLSVAATVEILRSLNAQEGTNVRTACVALLCALKNGPKPLALEDLTQGSGSGYVAVRALLLDALEDRVPFDPRVLARLIQKFPIVDAAVTSEGQKYVLHHLDKDPPALSGLAVQLKLLTDDSLPWGLQHGPAVLDTLAAGAHWDMAELLVASAHPDLRALLAPRLIPPLIAGKQYRQAAKCAVQWGLRDRFPEAEYLHRLHSIRKFLKKGLWKFAEDRANTQRLRLHLIEGLLEANNFTLAAELREKFELQGVVPEIDEAVIERERLARRQRYLQLPLAPEDVLFADDPDLLRSRFGPLFVDSVRAGTPQIVGLDAEWRPGRRRHTEPPEDSDLASPVANGEDIDPEDPPADGCMTTGAGPSTSTSSSTASPNPAGKAKANQAALLQLASRDCVLLLDLPTLCGTEEGCEALDALVRAVFWDADITKLGLGIGHDLAVLHSSWPQVTGFTRCSRVLDIGEFGSSVQYNGLGKGLSAASELWLGKPLDKSQQCSDWEARPLSEAQVAYAALDAWCSCAIFDRVVEAAAAAAVSRAPVGEPPRNSADVVASQFWFKHCTEFSKTAEAAADCELVAGQAPGEMEPLGPEDVRRCVEAVFPNYDELQLIRPAVPAGSVAGKSVALLAEGGPVVAVLPGAGRVDLGAVALALGKQRRHVRVASPAECQAIFGYPPGAVPPVAHRQPAVVLLDAGLSPSPPEAEPLLCLGAGAPGRFLCLTLAQLCAVSGGRVVDLAQASAFRGARSVAAIRCNSPLKRTPADSDQPSVNVSPSPSAARSTNHELAFCVDSMLGRVGRWLRAVGCDVEKVDARETEEQLALLQRIAASGKVLITSDRKLASRRTTAHIYFVAAKNPEVQFQDICNHFNIQFRESDFLSRCAACNNIGYYEVPIEEVRRRNVVFETTLERVTEFFACKSCDKIYWEGPRSTSYTDKFASLFEADGRIRLTSPTAI
eukprot:EG_transcript_1838